MKAFTLLSLAMLAALLLPAQTTTPYTETDKKALLVSDSLALTTNGLALYINANFTTNTSKARAIYIWLANNVKYDLANMYAINFYEKREEKIAKVLRTRTGICENYAAVFTDVCNQCCIRCYTIEGYTKPNGFVDYIPHAWCAAYIDTAWYLFDPTWGSGYVSNNQFYRKLNNDYFKVAPEKLIRTHMPFDPLWQFLNYTVTNQQFYEGKTTRTALSPFFNYKDSLTMYNLQRPIEQLAATAARIEKNGLRNSMLFDRLHHIKQEIEIYNQNQVIEETNKKSALYNEAASEMNDGINDFNEFVQYRNKQFEPLKSDAGIQEMMDKPQRKLISAQTKLGSITNPDASLNSLIITAQRSLDDVLKQVNEQQLFLKEYFSKRPAGRRNMFYQTTFFGMPVK